MRVEFSIPGEPFGKQRPKFSTYGGRITTRTPQKTVVYENLVKLEYLSQCKGKRFADDAMLKVSIRAFYSIPQSTSKKKKAAMLEGKLRPTKAPDVDNICKSVMDALNKIAYRDDAQAVECLVRKFYSETPRVDVTIEDISE